MFYPPAHKISLLLLFEVLSVLLVFLTPVLLAVLLPGQAPPGLVPFLFLVADQLIILNGFQS